MFLHKLWYYLIFDGLLEFTNKYIWARCFLGVILVITLSISSVIFDWFKLSNTRVRILVVCIYLGSYLFHVDFQVYMNIGWQSNPSVFKFQWLFLLFIYYLVCLCDLPSFIKPAYGLSALKNGISICYSVSHSFLLSSFVLFCCSFFPRFLLNFMRLYFNSFIFIPLFLHINVFMAVNLPQITAINVSHTFWYVVLHSHSL